MGVFDKFINIIFHPDLDLRQTSVFFDAVEAASFRDLSASQLLTDALHLGAAINLNSCQRRVTSLQSSSIPHINEHNEMSLMVVFDF